MEMLTHMNWTLAASLCKERIEVLYWILCRPIPQYDEVANQTIITLGVEPYSELEEENGKPFDLTESDLLAKDLTAEIFIDSDVLEIEEKYKTITVRANGTTKAIQMELEK